MAMSSRPPSAAGTSTSPFGAYTSLGIIGRGKYSEVHRAIRQVDPRDPNPGPPEYVAIKKVQIFDMDSHGRNECLNEANILQYKHSYLYENDLYLILELAESGDISLLLEQQRQKGSYFQEAEIWHYFVQIADALHVMHQCRVMHRDIKPQNVFVTASASAAAPSASPLRAGLTIKLGDLGLGRYLSSKTVETFSSVGTPLYMSPEAIANTGYDFKSDVWSCGCLLYEMTALKSPFYSTSLNFFTLGNAITKGAYAPPPAHFSSTLRRLLAWMIQPLPDNRPDIATVLNVARMACQSILRDGTVSDAIPVGPQQQPQQPQPRVAAAAAAADSMGD